MKNDNQTMDRAIPVSEQRRRKLRRIAVAVAIAVAVLGAGAWLGTQMIPTLDRKALIISEVDRGTIDVSVSATGRIVPAFEEIIVSPISSKILEVYAHSGDSVDVGTPLLRLDLQSAETDYSKALDEREIRRQQTAQLKANVETQLSDRRMQIEVKEMELSQLEARAPSRPPYAAVTERHLREGTRREAPHPRRCQDPLAAPCHAHLHQ